MEHDNYNQLQKQLQLIKEVVTADTYNLGDLFFETIVEKLNTVLNGTYTFVGKLISNDTAVETIALYGNGKILDNFVYELKDTPCYNVVGRSVCSYERNVTSFFPKDQLLIDMGIEAYVGVPLFNSMMMPTGLIVTLFDRPIEDAATYESVLMLFASRAGAELQHKTLYNELYGLQMDYAKQNEELLLHKTQLEKMVEKRTVELKNTNNELQNKNEELNKAFIQLKEMQSNLVQSEKMASLGVLTAGVAHEINNPLNYIMGSYVGLKEMCKSLAPEQTEHATMFLETLKLGIDRAATIVQSLNQFSRNNVDFKEECDIPAIIDNCISVLQHQIKNKITINKNIASEICIIEGNSGKLHQVFINLLSNSIQAIEGKGSIQIDVKSKEGYLYVIINDNGSGIEQELLGKITDPFFTTKPPGEGTGLGLYITYNIINEHNGCLDIASSDHDGATATVVLPLKQ